eukprot:g4033.t1
MIAAGEEPMESLYVPARLGRRGGSLYLGRKRCSPKRKSEAPFATDDDNHTPFDTNKVVIRTKVPYGTDRDNFIVEKKTSSRVSAPYGTDVDVPLPQSAPTRTKSDGIDNIVSYSSSLAGNNYFNSNSCKQRKKYEYNPKQLKKALDEQIEYRQKIKLEEKQRKENQAIMTDRLIQEAKSIENEQYLNELRQYGEYSRLRSLERNRRQKMRKDNFLQFKRTQALQKVQREGTQGWSFFNNSSTQPRKRGKRLNIAGRNFITNKSEVF